MPTNVAVASTLTRRASLGSSVDRRRDDRGEMDDRRGRGFGNQALNLIGVGEVGPPELDTAGQFLGRLEVGGGVEVGGDDAAAVGRQAPHSLGPDQTKAACDKYGVGH